MSKVQNVSKDELIGMLMEDTGLSKKLATGAVSSVVDIIKKVTMANHSVIIRGFGSFTPVVRQQTVGRDIGKGESVIIPERNFVRFKPAKSFLQDLNNK